MYTLNGFLIQGNAAEAGHFHLAMIFRSLENTWAHRAKALMCYFVDMVRAIACWYLTRPVFMQLWACDAHFYVAAGRFRLRTSRR